MGGSNPDQLSLISKKCEKTNSCRIEASRDFFGDSECTGTEDAKMSLWLVYSCNRGGTDKTTSYQPECDDNDGEQKQLDVRGCGAWLKLNCDGGSLDIQKVCTGSLIEHNSRL